MRVENYNHYWLQLYFKDDEEREKFKKLVSFRLPHAKFNTAFKAGHWSGDRIFLTDKNKIPLGLFKYLYPEHELVSDKTFVDISFTDIPLFGNTKYEQRDYQLKAINTIFKNKRNLIAAIMGAGKTLIAAGAMSYHLKQSATNKILFVCYDKNILSQSITNFKNYGFKVSQFGDGIKDLSGDVIIGTIQSLSRIHNPKEVLKNITMCFSDEAHHGSSKTSRDVLTKLYNCEYYIGLTATPPKKKTVELAELMSVLGPITFEYGFDEATADKKIVPVKAFFLDGSIDLNVKEKVFVRKHYQTIWDNAIKENKYRNDQISLILSSLITLLDTSNIVLVDRVEHGISLIDSLRGQKNISATTMYGSDDIAMREIKKTQLSSDTINTLVSTVLTEGVDLKIAPVVALNASGRKGFIKMIQFLGRIVRGNEKFKNFRVYVDFYDRYHPMLKSHSDARMKACKDFGVEVVTCTSVKDLIMEIAKYYKQVEHISK